MSDLRLTFAIGDYLHMRELTLGRIKPEGIDLTVLTLPLETIAYRFLAGYEWEVSEFSLATYCAMMANGNCPMVGLPVFPSRVFRHGSIFVRDRSPIKTAADLKGKRIGIPQWTQTAVTYVRGWLQHEVGVPLTSIDWIQAGVNDPGRKEMTTFELPPGYKLTSGAAPRRLRANRRIGRNVEALERPTRACLPGQRPDMSRARCARAPRRRP
jgi:4,5-dihydroxyphthalate decarboxylase